MINIVLFQPEIPQNTGNIGRTCVLTGSSLHLIKPLGFELSDYHVKRTGLDYWKDLDLHVYENWEDFLDNNPNANIYAITTKGNKVYSDIEIKENDYFLFGKESKGLPDNIREILRETLVRVPMIETTTRSLNLSNTVAIIAYDALRKLGFPQMK